MPRKTDGEKIDELEKVVAALIERQDTQRKDIDYFHENQQKTTSELNDLKMKVAVIEERLGELKKGLEESTRRRWAILPAMVAAVIGSLLTLLGQLILGYFKGHTP